MATVSPPRETVQSIGCHLSWPELQSIAVDRQNLIREERILAQEEWDFNDRPTYYTAIRNLQGFIAYHLNKHEQAFVFFLDVLDKDESNINALGNLAFMHKKIYQIDKHKRYQGKLASVLDGPSYGERARYYAEKAFATRNFEQFKRCFQYMGLIEKAATIGRNCEGPHRAEWFFDYALALYRRDVQMLYLRKLANEGPAVSDQSECYSDERIKEGFLKACRYFREVVRTSTSKDYRALSWVFLGILVNHDPEHRSLSMALPEEPDLHLTAEQCYNEGLNIHLNYPITIRRVGSEYVKLGRFEEARKLLDKSLGILPSQFGYRHRALMFLGMYEAANDDERRTEQARQWLLEAVRDFDQALSMNAFHADYSDLGYVYFLLGNIDSALCKFQQAAASEQDDYFDPVLTHRRWAKCLEKDNQPEGSLLQLEEARKVRNKILATPLEEGLIAANGTKCVYPYDFFLWCSEEDSQWTEEFVERLTSKNRNLSIKQRQLFNAGTWFLEEIVRSLRESYKVLIVLSRKASDQSYVIEHAVLEGIRRRDRGREYIVPIKLQDREVPDVLLNVTTILACENGQLSHEHCDDLVYKLTQQP